MSAFRIQIIKNHLNHAIQLRINRTFSQSVAFQNKVAPVFDKAFYEENGYFVIRKLVPNYILESCRQRFLDVCENKVEKGFMIITKERSLMSKGFSGEQLINKVGEIAHDDVFQMYTDCKDMLDVIEHIIGPNIMAATSMFINKPPGTTQHPPHQDLFYFPFRPEDLIVGTWTAVDKTCKENGCLFVVPGSHKNHTLYQHEYPQYENQPNKAYHGILNENDVAPKSQRVDLPMEVGDTVFFHPLILHGSGTNLTKGYRKAVSCHYASSQCHYIDVTGTVQEEVGKEIEGMVRSKSLPNITFKEFYQMKMKLVRGKVMTL